MEQRSTVLPACERLAIVHQLELPCSVLLVLLIVVERGGDRDLGWTVELHALDILHHREVCQRRRIDLELSL